MRSRIMYIEHKPDGLHGNARIGRVSASQTGRSLYYQGRTFKPIKSYKVNYIDAKSGEEYWISGCKKNGQDRLYSGTIAIDEDVREEYWLKIRQMPESVAKRSIRCTGKYSH